MKKNTFMSLTLLLLILPTPVLAQMPVFPTATGRSTFGLGYQNFQVSTAGVNNGILGYDAQVISLNFGHFHSDRLIYTSALGIAMPAAGEAKINSFFYGSAGMQYQYTLPKQRLTLFAFLTANGGYTGATEHHPLLETLRLRLGFGGAYLMSRVRPFIAIFEQTRRFNASSGSTLILNKIETFFLTEIGISADIHEGFSVVGSLQIPLIQNREVVTQISANFRY